MWCGATTMSLTLDVIATEAYPAWRYEHPKTFTNNVIKGTCILPNFITSNLIWLVSWRTYISNSNTTTHITSKMNSIILVLFTLLAFFSSTNGKKASELRKTSEAVQLPEVGLDVEDYIAYKGYEYETHEIQTKDGHILSIHRIPYGLKNNTKYDRPVVFLMHGLLGGSSCFIVNDVDKSLGFMLADLGYDVWMGNARGTTHSRKHTSYDPDKDKAAFWDFSFHEIGNYDLSAMIDYVLETTGQEKLHYIGHSQGTTSFFALAASQPEYNDKIKLMVALAPVAFMTNIPNEIAKSLASNSAFLQWLAEAMELYELFPHWEWLTIFGQQYCNDESDSQDKCAEILYHIGGKNENQLNKTMIPIIFSTLPAGASVKQFLHYGQAIMSGMFRQYDYGPLKNLIKYGSFSPPSYDLSSISAPVALFYGNNDMLTAVVDVEELQQYLPNVVYTHLIEDELFTHLDFLWAIELNELVNNYVIDLLAKY